MRRGVIRIILLNNSECDKKRMCFNREVAADCQQSGHYSVIRAAANAEKGSLKANKSQLDLIKIDDCARRVQTSPNLNTHDTETS